jgi:hypothetical protein
MLLAAMLLPGCGKDSEQDAEKSDRDAVTVTEPASQATAPVADTKSVVIELGELTSPDGFSPYQIRPPVGYKASTHDDKENANAKIYRWQGELYDLTSTLSSMPYLDVTIWKDSTGATTAEYEIAQELKSLSDSKSDWQQSDITSDPLNQLPFYKCDYQFSDDRFGSGKGFLYGAVDGGTVILMSSAVYASGSYDDLDIARASARTFQKSAEPLALPETESVAVAPQNALENAESADTVTSDGAAGTDSMQQPTSPPTDQRVISPSPPQQEVRDRTAESAEDETDSPPASSFRTWQDASGKFSVEAEFAGYGLGKVSLKNADGTKISVPLEKLSQQDQEWIRNRGDEPSAR